MSSAGTQIQEIIDQVTSVYNLLSKAKTDIEGCGAPGSTQAAEAIETVANNYLTAYIFSLPAIKIREES